METITRNIDFARRRELENKRQLIRYAIVERRTHSTDVVRNRQNTLVRSSQLVVDELLSTINELVQRRFVRR